MATDFVFYSVVYNDVEEYVIISPKFKNHRVKFLINDTIIDSKLIECEHKHTNVYISVKSGISYYEYIDIQVDENYILEKVQVSKFPSLVDKIVFSTLVKNEQKVIRQWIDYHHILGVDHFIIYDNAVDDYSLKLFLEDYIRNGIVIYIRWPFPYYTSAGISGQTTQQNHSIYTFRKSRFIGMFDVDEYLNLQQHIHLNDFLNCVVADMKLNLDAIGGLEMISKIFTNPQNKPTDGFNFLRITHCTGFIRGSRQKMLVRPLNVQIFSVHMIVAGLSTITIPEKYGYFNHYMFLNKTNRGMELQTHQDDSICHLSRKLKIII
jgi:hypothetical protein